MLKNRIYVISFLITTSCTSIRYQVLTDRSFYAEAESSRVSVHCSPEDKNNKNSFTYIFLLGESRIDKILFRRPWPYKSCQRDRAAIKKLIASNARVKILASESSLVSGGIPKDDKGYAPENPGNKPVYYWFFETIEGGGLCIEYLSGACDGTLAERLNIEDSSLN